MTKLFEKCVVELVLVAGEINKATPQAQAGSRKGRSTRDQMLKLVILQKYHESQSREWDQSFKLEKKLQFFSLNLLSIPWDIP